jgi:putative FmdB family regulatory protein
MPIYEYRCAACGFQKEYLQRMNDAPLTDCPECGKCDFSKMVTAAGFQLKGSGWYATDFKNGSKPAKSADKPADGGAAKKEDSKESKTEAACGTGACPACS